MDTLRTIAIRAALLLALLGWGTAWAGIDQWTSLGPPDGTITALAIDARNPGTLYAGTLRGGLFRSTDGGSTWNPANSGLTATRVNALATDPRNPSIVYAGGDGKAFFKSTDGGKTWRASNSGLTAPLVWAVAIDPQNPGMVYAGTDGGVFKSTDAGSTWNPANSGLTATRVNALAIDPRNPGTLYAAGNFSTPTCPPCINAVFKSMDGGLTWKSSSPNFARAVGGCCALILDLAVDPQTPTTVYASTGDVNDTGGALWKSTDGGSNWQNLFPSSQTDVTALAVDPQKPNTIYVGSDGGLLPFASTVRKSIDGGATWNAVDFGLTGTGVGLLAVDPQNPSMVYAVAYDSGAFAITFPPTTAPSIFAAVDGASLKGGSASAGGSITSLYGTGLATYAVGATTVPLPVSLSGTSVRINSDCCGTVAAPLFYVSPMQINFQFPWEACCGDTGRVTFTVTVNGVSSAPLESGSAAFGSGPGLFSINSSGSGQGAVQIANTSIFAAPTGSIPGAQSRPAQRGDYLSIYCTGLGYVGKAPPAGAPAPDDPLATTRFTPTVTIGGISAPVTFSGLAPGTVGVYQVNVQVPAGAPTGDAVPVRLTISEIPSLNTVTIAVQ